MLTKTGVDFVCNDRASWLADIRLRLFFFNEREDIGEWLSYVDLASNSDSATSQLWKHTQKTYPV